MGKSGKRPTATSAEDSAGTTSQRPSRNLPTRNGTLRHRLVENEIYEHATRLFAERGVERTSLELIAREMGMTRSALYHYVKSKDELVATLVKEITERPAAEIAEITGRTDLDPAGKLAALAKLVARGRASGPSRFRLVLRAEAQLPAELAEANAKTKRTALQAFTQVIEDGIVAGSFRPVHPQTAALAILGMSNWVAWWEHPDVTATDEEIADRLADLAVSMVRQEAGRISSGPQPAAAFDLLRQDVDYLERVLGERATPPRE